MKNKLWVSFLIFLILFCAFFFKYAYDDAKKTAIIDLNEKQISYARQASIGIDDFFKQWTNVLTSITQMSNIANLDETGKKFISFTYEINKADITAVSRVDAKGKIIFTAPLDPKAIGQDISGQKHIQEVMRFHKPIVSDVFKSVQGFDMVALHVPVLKNGKYQGTIAIGINFQNLSKRYLEKIKFGKTGYAWMISRDGRELYCPVPGHTGKSVFENGKDYPDIIAMAGEMLKEKQGVTTYTFDQIGEQNVELVKKHAVYMPVHIGQTFWSIVVASSESEILSSLESFRNKLILIVGLFLVGSALFSFFGLRGWFIFREEQMRKKAEVALRKSEENFRSSLDNSPLGVRIATAEGETIYANRAILDIISIEELNTTPLMKRYTPESYAEFQIRKEKRKRGNYGPSEYEVSIVRKDGEVRHLQVFRNEILWNGEKQFQVIYQDITERKQAEKKIKASLLEKETMLKEIHHRVKNNLQVISSLLSLQASYLQDEKAREALEESIERVGTMASIHTQLYESQDLTKVDFGSFIQALIGNISQSHGRTESPVEIKVDAGEISLGIDNSIPCGLILNELISNALKHAFPGGKEGEINIRMRSEDNQMVLMVQDNGIGIPESIDLTNLKSLGLELVNLLVGQMNGKIDMRVDSGTMWTITFPIKSDREWQNG